MIESFADLVVPWLPEEGPSWFSKEKVKQDMILWISDRDNPSTLEHLSDLVI